MIRRFIENIYEYFVSRQCLHIPHHIAIIQDGNRRFQKKELPRLPGIAQEQTGLKSVWNGPRNWEYVISPYIFHREF